MRYSLVLAALLLSIGTQPLAAQAVSEANGRRFAEDLSASQIRKNAPDDAAFSRMLQRDLNAYFRHEGFRGAVVRFALLRRSATQSGVAYPKFYLWVEVRSAAGRQTSGAVRVAAIERKQFAVTNFLSAQAIRADPGRVGSVFPVALVQGIIDRAIASSPHGR